MCNGVSSLFVFFLACCVVSLWESNLWMSMICVVSCVQWVSSRIHLHLLTIHQVCVQMSCLPFICFSSVLIVYLIVLWHEFIISSFLSVLAWENITIGNFIIKILCCQIFFFLDLFLLVSVACLFCVLFFCF